MSKLCFPFALLLLCLKVSSVPFGPRSLLRAIGHDNADPSDAAVELNATSFNEVLRDTPASHAIVEFFAHWCPACRNYKPHYEKVARLFNGPTAVHPGLILMARVDCALKINSKLCDKFSVGHFPMLLWGSPTKFSSGSWDSRQNKSEIRMVDDGRTADRLLYWINKQIGSSYNLDDEKFVNDHLSPNVSDPGQIVRAVFDVEEATSTAFDIILENKMVKSETRGSLLRFLQVLVAHHPSKSCRKGIAELLVNFDDLWGTNAWSVDKSHTISARNALGNFHICGKDVPRGYWMFCRGSKNDTRGFSCGLWVLLHSLSVRIDDGESQMVFLATCDFIHDFFICEECRKHFHQMCSSVSNPFNTAREFALWLWRAHNQVNERLMKVEASLGTGDPKFPKNIWPTQRLCSPCRSSQNNKWNENEVFGFLSKYYGESLVSLFKEKEVLKGSNDSAVIVNENAVVVVPLGAALGISVASCAFGGVAWLWRKTQKKTRRSWN